MIFILINVGNSDTTTKTNDAETSPLSGSTTQKGIKLTSIDQSFNICIPMYINLKIYLPMLVGIDAKTTTDGNEVPSTSSSAAQNGIYSNSCN